MNAQWRFQYRVDARDEYKSIEVAASDEAQAKAFVIDELHSLGWSPFITEWAQVLNSVESADLTRARSEGEIVATPFKWPDPAQIPRRRWLFGHWLLRGEYTTVIAPTGVGKSTFTTGINLSLASGIPFLGKDLPEGPIATWQWNLEDAQDELDRQVSACALRHGAGPDECGNRLHVDSGLDQSLCTAIDGPDGFKIVEPVFEKLKAQIVSRGIDVLTIDPFVSSHEIDENSNVLMDKVAKRWKRLAHETDCAIMLVHHTKKMGGREVTAEDGRGAVAVVSGGRIVLTLNKMTNEEAERFGITDKSEQLSMFRVDNEKANRSPAENATWFKKESVSLGNGDDVGAAVPWTPPDPFEGISARDLYNAQQAIAGGEYGANVQAADWAGKAIAEVLGMDIESKADKAKVKAILGTWTHNGAFKVEKRATGKGREKPFLIVGKPIDPALLPTPISGVG